MTKRTISISEDAYERLEGMKREGESFTDVILRLTIRVDLRDYHGVLSDNTGTELEHVIRERRAHRDALRTDRRDRLRDSLDDS